MGSLSGPSSQPGLKSNVGALVIHTGTSRQSVGSDSTGTGHAESPGPPRRSPCTSSLLTDLEPHYVEQAG